jgi:glycosyltransferase involved in cell wall biosynthesis
MADSNKAGPLISIVMPAYNAARFIEQTMDSLLDQTFRDYEIVVVDDGSTDVTPQKLNQYGGRIRLIRQANRGPEIARNTGIEQSRGEYVVAFDADDILYPYALEVYAATIRRFHRPPLLLGTLTYFGGEEEPKPGHWDGTIRLTESLCFFKKRDSVSVSNSNIVARRDALVRVNGYQLNAPYDDRCLLFRLGIESPFLTIDYPETVAYRLHGASFSKSLDVMVRGAAVICASERRGLYPGGKAVRADRRGLIASNVAANVRRHVPRFTAGSKWQKGRAMLRMLLSVRFFFLSGFMRRARKRAYPAKEHKFTTR